jgi:hypothetical protein
MRLFTNINDAYHHALAAREETRGHKPGESGIPVTRRTIVLATDLFGRLARHARREGFDSVQAYVHVLLQRTLDKS